jgi:hypothetical protein
MRMFRKVIWLLAVALLCNCQTPAILVPTADSAGCNPNTEHDCAGGGCCLTNWACGGQQPDLFTTCPADACCPEFDPTQLSARRPTKKRYPNVR